eukprot:6471137-Amphidinium_carterae.1
MPTNCSLQRKLKGHGKLESAESPSSTVERATTFSQQLGHRTLDGSPSRRDLAARLVGSPCNACISPAPAWSSCLIRRDGLQTCADWPLPSIGSWNARALCHHNFVARASKLKILHQLCSAASIVTVQEAHAVGLHDFAEGELPRSHKAYYSGDSAISGGILVLVHHSIFTVTTVEWHEMFVGRVCALHLTHRGYLRRYIFVHFTPSQSSSWEDLLQLATQDIADDSPLTFLVGDTNVSGEVGDQITVATGEATLHFGPLLSIGSVPLAISTRFRLGGHQCQRPPVGGWKSPPGLSDHWPILITFDPSEERDTGHPKWTAMHSAYMPSVEKWCSHIGLDLRSSSAALRDIYSIVENAVADVRAAARAIEPHPAVQLSVMLQTLHACLRGNARRTSELLNIAPGWNIPPSTRLPNVVVKLIPQIRAMQEQVQKLAPDADHTTEGTKDGWASFMYSAWRKLRSSPLVGVHLGDDA